MNASSVYSIYWSISKSGEGARYYPVDRDFDSNNVSLSPAQAEALALYGRNIDGSVSNISASVVVFDPPPNLDYQHIDEGLDNDGGDLGFYVSSDLSSTSSRLTGVNYTCIAFTSVSKLLKTHEVL